MTPVGFDWDDDKNALNVAKHGVDFDEAMTVFDDPIAGYRDDPDHSKSEQRMLITGSSVAGRLLLVSFTERDDLIRIINARAATPREKRHHEQANKSRQ
jgi:hypothetical protein